MEIMEYAENILQTIGNTPLVKLHALANRVKPTVLVKLDYLNPAGSMKDRMAVSMVQAAEHEGRLKKNGTIVEPTSGNTGAGIAMIAALKGYKFIAVMPEKVSHEKELVLRSYGAEVVRTRGDVNADHPAYYVNLARSIAKEKNAVMLDQYNNPANPRAYYESLGPEIFRDTDGKITHFVATMGTGGSISGTARYLKEKNPQIKIIGIDADGSLLHHYYHHTKGKAHPYKVEGPGKDFMPESLAMRYIDDVLVVNDKQSFVTAREMAKAEGIFAGGSSGMAVYGALQVAKKLSQDDLLVVLLPDSGRGYLSKFYNDTWMKENDLL